MAWFIWNMVPHIKKKTNDYRPQNTKRTNASRCQFAIFHQKVIFKPKISFISENTNTFSRFHQINILNPILFLYITGKTGESLEWASILHKTHTLSIHTVSMNLFLQRMFTSQGFSKAIRYESTACLVRLDRHEVQQEVTHRNRQAQRGFL